MLTVVIPCFNEEDVLPQLFASLTEFAEKATVEVQFLLIDDGSRDRTPLLLSEQASKDSRFAFVRFSRNFGHQIAVSAGLVHAQGDVVAVLDADLQDPPEVVWQMVEKWREGYDVVYGVREKRKENLFLRAGYSGFYRLMKLVARIDMPLDAGDFCVMDRRVVDAINRLPERGRFVRGLRVWVGFRQIGLPYERAARAAGAPKYNLLRLINLAVDGLVSFSSVPLRLASWLGFLASSLSLLLMFWAVGSVLFLGKQPPGWASTAVLITFFSGVQLIVLGIIGEYLGRIFEEVKGRPQYLIDLKGGWLEKDGK